MHIQVHNFGVSIQVKSPGNDKYLYISIYLNCLCKDAFPKLYTF